MTKIMFTTKSSGVCLILYVKCEIRKVFQPSVSAKDDQISVHSHYSLPGYLMCIPTRVEVGTQHSIRDLLFVGMCRNHSLRLHSSIDVAIHVPYLWYIQ